MKPYLEKFIVCVMIMVAALHTQGQIKDIGLPFIVNHTRDKYAAGTQNWSVAQSSKDFLYFANNDGILEYDGTGWQTYPVPNASLVRSVMAAGDTIYAGAFEQFGFLAPGGDGKLVWNPLEHLVPADYSRFDEIWNIFKADNDLIFQSFSTIFVFHDDTISVVEPSSNFGFMYQAGDKLYVADTGKGLMRFENRSLKLVSNHPVFLHNEITFILDYGSGNLLIGTSNDGAFVWNGDSMNPWQADLNNFLKDHKPYTGIRLSCGSMAFGTISDGVYVTDAKGTLLQHLNRVKGLQNNTVLSLYEDRRNNLWLGLDNGIDFVEISSPLTYFNHNHQIESAYASLIHDGILYVGTNQGLFAAELNGTGNYSINDGFELIRGTEGQVWSLHVIGNTLLCGHNYGCFQIDGLTARKVSDVRGFWSFIEHPAMNDTIIAGSYSGLIRLQNVGGQWLFLDEIEGFRESSRDLVFDDHGLLWIAHGYRGLFRLKMNKDFSRVDDIRLFHDEAGLPAELPYNIHQANNQMVVSTHAGLLVYDHAGERFVPDTRMDALFEDIGFVDKIHQDKNGNLWYFTNTRMGVMRLLEDGSFRNIRPPFARINDVMIPAFQNIYIANDQNVFIGSQNGLVHYNPYIINDYNKVEPVYINEVSFYGKQDTSPLYFYGIGATKEMEEIPKLPFSHNSMSFRFTTPSYESPATIRFSYKLEGFDNEWSEWTTLNVKEYTNLREGDYVFQVKALNAFGVESQITPFHFTVNPPLLRSNAAYFTYVVLIILIVAGNAIYIRRRVLRVRRKEKFRHEKRLAQREKLFKEQSELSEKEIMQLRNESLENEMRYKNQELANATLHLIQKNKTLTTLKNDLNKLLKGIPDTHPERHNVGQLLKKVNKDLKNKKNWELFNSYFDDVHQDFITQLKESHTDLTPRELRLCAYLRMNLSTKEIAPLMSISVRGVEISRYRLRKKLRIDHNTNLTEYLISY